MIETATGFAINGSARLYYEVAGSGQPVVLLHAGVADSRQWNHEFGWLAERYRVVRYDLRGYGRSEPVAGDFSHLEDLQVVLRIVEISEPVLAIGCSMGGTLAMDFALEYPALVRGLVMVGSGPSVLSRSFASLQSPCRRPEQDGFRGQYRDIAKGPNTVPAYGRGSRRASLTRRLAALRLLPMALAIWGHWRRNAPCQTPCKTR